jgi:hypothetical protein
MRPASHTCLPPDRVVAGSRVNLSRRTVTGFRPFAGEVDLTRVPAGRYPFVVWTDDPSGEGNSFTDSRVITVE